MDARLDEATYRAARESAAAWPTGRDALQLVGEDRVSFLHGMVTNDVKGLEAGGVNYAAMLTPKGQMIGDARVWKRAADLVLDTEPAHGEAVKQFLEKYLISEDAEVRVSELAVVALLGPAAAAALNVSPPAGKFQPLELDGAPAFAAASLLLGRPGVDVLLPREKVPALLARLSLPLLNEATWEVLRVEAGMPRFGLDMDEATIPLEANLERAIHYNKGCYVGQEVIARATFRGHMNRKLVGLLLGVQQPAPKTELRSGERKVGWVTTVIDSPALGQKAALAYLHRDFLAPGTKVQLAGGGEAEVRALPLVAA
jgi:folate-binding protein YgfZ